MEFSCSILLTRIVRQWCFGSHQKSKYGEIWVSECCFWKIYFIRATFLYVLFQQSIIQMCVRRVQKPDTFILRGEKIRHNLLLLRTFIFALILYFCLLISDARAKTQAIFCMITISNSCKQIYNHSLREQTDLSWEQPRIRDNGMIYLSL